jgi:hypothetical protein
MVKVYAISVASPLIPKSFHLVLEIPYVDAAVVIMLLRK